MNVDVAGAAKVLAAFLAGQEVLVVAMQPTRLCEAFVETLRTLPLTDTDVTITSNRITGDGTIRFVPPDAGRLAGHSPDLLALQGEAGWPMAGVVELEQAIAAVETAGAGNRIHL